MEPQSQSTTTAKGKTGKSIILPAMRTFFIGVIVLGAVLFLLAGTAPLLARLGVYHSLHGPDDPARHLPCHEGPGPPGAAQEHRTRVGINDSRESSYSSDFWVSSARSSSLRSIIVSGGLRCHPLSHWPEMR